MSGVVYRVVLVGIGGVGKSCLTIQFIADRFVEDYDPTLEDSYRKQVTVDSDEYLLDIFDTAGQEDFSAVRDQYMRTGDGFLCVYSVTLRNSFDEVEHFHEHILRVKDLDNEVPFVLVGNKCDLENDRKVTKEEGESLSKKLKCVFLEASAKTKVNVHEAFHALVREITSYQKTHKPKTGSTTKEKPKKSGCMLL